MAYLLPGGAVFQDDDSGNGFLLPGGMVFQSVYVAPEVTTSPRLVGGIAKKSRVTRKPIIVEIDNETFVVRSKEEALQLVEAARDAALQKAEAEAKDILSKREKKARRSQLNVSPLRLAEPQISVRSLDDSIVDPAWLKEVSGYLDSILESYREVAAKYETAILLRRQIELDEEDQLVALLLTI